MQSSTSNQASVADLESGIVYEGRSARMESQHRSERTKAGLAKIRAQGKKLGRPKGSKDKKKRKCIGYLARYVGLRPKLD